MNGLANGIGYAFIWLILTLIGFFMLRTILELIRRWFFNPEYRCDKCGSPVTALVKDSWDLCTGTLYKVRCYKPWCRHWNAERVFYYRGKGRSCGKGYNGWKRSRYADQV
jgi:hypothetical protein